MLSIQFIFLCALCEAQRAPEQMQTFLFPVRVPLFEQNGHSTYSTLNDRHLFSPHFIGSWALVSQNENVR